MDSSLRFPCFVTSTAWEEWQRPDMRWNWRHEDPAHVTRFWYPAPQQRICENLDFTATSRQSMQPSEIISYVWVGRTGRSIIVPYQILPRVCPPGDWFDIVLWDVESNHYEKRVSRADLEQQTDAHMQVKGLGRWEAVHSAAVALLMAG